MHGWLFLLEMPIDYFSWRRHHLAILARLLRTVRSARLGLVRQMSVFTLDHIIQTPVKASPSISKASPHSHNLLKIGVQSVERHPRFKSNEKKKQTPPLPIPSDRSLRRSEKTATRSKSPTEHTQTQLDNNAQAQDACSTVVTTGGVVHPGQTKERQHPMYNNNQQPDPGSAVPTS